MSTWNNPLRIEEIGTGEQAGTWGVTTNTNLAVALPEAITGQAQVIFPSDADYSLPYLNSNASQAFRNLVLYVTSDVNLNATRSLIIPSIEKQYFINNQTSNNQSITIKTTSVGAASVTVPYNQIAHVYCDGTNVRFADGFVGITGGTITGGTITGGTITGATISGLSSALGVTSGGTGLATATQGGILYASASNTYAALPKDTTATRYLSNTGTDNNPAWAQIDLTDGVINTLPVNRGGTGLATVTAGSLLLGAGTNAFTTLVGTVTGQVLSWNNSTATWEAGTLASGVSSFSAGTTGLTPNTGTTGAVTLGGTLDVDNGGTGQTSYTDGELLIGNSTGNTLAKATLTAGTGISITNGAGSITIANTSTTPNFQRFLYQASQPQTFTIPTGVTRVKVTVVGGGGGGGGYYSSGCSTLMGGGGGGGGAAIKWLSGLTPGSTLSVTVGAASTAGGSGNTSSVASGTQSITTISATGGAAGGAGFFGSGIGGAGGLGSNGDLNIGGSAGGFAINNPAINGIGGASILGGGGVATQGPGSNGQPYGGGGSGGGAWPTPNGLGAAGVVIFEW